MYKILDLFSSVLILKEFSNDSICNLSKNKDHPLALKVKFYIVFILEIQISVYNLYLNKYIWKNHW